MYEIKTEDVCEFLAMIRKCLILVITQLSEILWQFKEISGW